MKCSIWLLLALALSGVAGAAETPIEASMVIAGTITVDPQGDVASYTLHDEDKVPPGVVQIVQRTIKGWQFVPIVQDGKAVTATAGMSVRVVADMVDEGHATIHVAGASFGCDAYQAKALLPNACELGTTVSYDGRQRSPEYPVNALKERLGADVYLVVEVGRDGRVTRAEARQVNLFSRVTFPDTYRKVFAQNATAAAMHWRFTVPVAGPGAGQDHWVVRIPVFYSIGRARQIGYGQWSAYIPGPVQDIPWAKDDAASHAGSPDAVAGGGTPFVRDTRFVLKSQLGTDDSRS